MVKNKFDVEYFTEVHEKNKFSNNGELVDKNIVKSIGRDGSYSEKALSDEQIKALKAIVDQLRDAPDDL